MYLDISDARQAIQGETYKVTAISIGSKACRQLNADFRADKPTKHDEGLQQNGLDSSLETGVGLFD
jgi:hypothetical protein